MQGFEVLRGEGQPDETFWLLGRGQGFDNPKPKVPNPVAGGTAPGGLSLEGRAKPQYPVIDFDALGKTSDPKLNFGQLEFDHSGPLLRNGCDGAKEVGAPPSEARLGAGG